MKINAQRKRYVHLGLPEITAAGHLKNPCGPSFSYEYNQLGGIPTRLIHSIFVIKNNNNSTTKHAHYNYIAIKQESTKTTIF